MVEIELAVPPDARLQNAEELIERLCAAEQLRPTMKGTLAKHPGCVHWHYKLGLGPGVLEITLWAREHRIWFSIQEGRRADWIEEAAARLKAAIESRLK